MEESRRRYRRDVMACTADEELSQLCLRSPPHARGSTLPKDAKAIIWCVSPARAGIDLCSESS